MTGELIPLDLLPSVQGPGRHHPALPDRPDRGHQPVQLPAQPGRAQARAGHRRGQPDRAQAAVQGPADDAHRGRDHRAGRACRRAAVSILPMTRELGDRMVADERFKLLTFTGSPERRLADEGARRQEEGRARARRQRRRHRRRSRPTSTGRSSARSSAPSPTPARCASASSACSSTRPSGTTFMAEFVEGVAALVVGDPLDPETDVGPMVDAGQAARTQRWVDEAVALGGRVLAGGRADGTFFPPTVLDDVPDDAQVCSNEAFAPLVVAFPFDDFDEAIAPGQRQHLRAPDRRLHQRPRRRLAGVQRARGRRRHRQRHPDLPHRPHALRRGQGLGPRPRGPALGHRGHDRAAHHGPRPAGLRPRVMRYDRVVPGMHRSEAG